MSVRYQHAPGGGDEIKIIEAEDTYTGLVDALCDMMLLSGGVNQKFHEQLDAAMTSAEHTHWSAEKGGESEGVPIFVDPQKGDEPIVPLKEWVDGA